MAKTTHQDQPRQASPRAPGAHGYLADLSAGWLHPVDNPPPRSTKIIILSPYGVSQVGDWYDGAAAWMPLVKIDAGLKKRLQKEGRLK